MKKIVCLVALLLLGACTEYQYIPPPTKEGQACAMQCGMQRQQCRGMAQQGHQQCQMMRSMAMTAYNQCRASGRGGCSQPPSCLDDIWRCNGDFDRCFQSCGGRIVEVK